ncbi:CHC2 zinc finger domain-containing protein [Cellulophaga sp. 20_2_10]|uniref:CHC2 zinc finger domain-containing protein n=1 Tax=Cellulophaga sp. 20_2_10 TaxID=2942476 RepID=UPI00201ABD4D|nr:CHC2 zinc finger domain-containing protein [Cellulophaga sp. 20_2_10]MCL5246543.1 CHC2 zinc finger domain-containing protein [Cellulophaga sp. 20_2_10]
MNCNKAKNIDLLLYLIKNGFKPQKITGQNHWFLSPFRKEKTASFKVDTDKNTWYDFGSGHGGTIIDFLQEYYGCAISEVLNKLTEDTFSFHQQKIISPHTKKGDIIKVKALQNKYLIAYLKEREINLELAKEFCFEVYYTFDSNKTYYAIGFKNDLGGFELRNQFFKGCIGRKHFTTIKRDYSTVSVFESWSDFLSYLTLKNKVPEEDFIILNSTALIKKALEIVNQYCVVKSFFDNDESGSNTLQIIKDNRGLEVFDYRYYYKNHKDLNAFLINSKMANG